MDNKFAHTCAEYEAARTKVNILSSAIGDQLGHCYEARLKENQCADPKDNHLAVAYSPGEQDYYGEADFLSPEEQEEVLAECKYCQSAHRLIQERKEWRQKFGIAKRRISTYGKQALEAGQ